MFSQLFQSLSFAIRRQPPAGREHVGPDMIAGSHAFSLKPLLQLAAHRDIPCSFKQGCNAFISA